MGNRIREIKEQYASNLKQVRRDCRKVKRLEIKLKYSKKISERKDITQQLEVLNGGIEDMLDQNRQAEEKVKSL